MAPSSRTVSSVMTRASVVLLSTLTLFLLEGLPGAFAGEPEPWPVDRKLLGKKDKHSKDVSGIACMPGGSERKCLVIDDEVQFAQFVIIGDGRLLAGDTIDLVTPDNTPWNIDGEGVTFAPAGQGKQDYFYVIGSHGHPRDRDGSLHAIADAGEIKARYDASSVLVRIPVGKSTIDDKGRLEHKIKGTTLADLRPMIYGEPALAPLRPFLGKRLEEAQRGLNFEGIAAVGDRLYVGLRAPTLRADGSAAEPKFPDERAAIFSFDRDAPFAKTAANARLHLVPLGEKRGIRDLAVNGDTILILAGPAYEPNKAKAEGQKGEYSIYSWDRSSDPKLLIDLPQHEEDGKALKPEALVMLKAHADGGLNILLMFDGAHEGGPRLLENVK